MTRITFNRTSALALALGCLLLGLAIAAAAAVSQASPSAVGQSFGILGAITGLSAAMLGIAWERISRQSVGQ
jgi:hypothetical protein